jgi:hypothetical protein
MDFQLWKLRALAIANDAIRGTIDERERLLRKALEHHEAGRYDASVPLVLAQMDGIVIDLTGNQWRNFFKDGGKYVVDEETLAGHPDSGLKAIATLMSGPAITTAASGKLTRHGILHGRELGYDTLLNSTKAFAALFALIEWAVARAQRMYDERRAGEEAANAGKTDVDEDGRRIDRRGFDDAKQTLGQLAQMQFGAFKRQGAYRSNLDELAPPNMKTLLRIPLDRIILGSSADGTSYWLAAKAETDYWFGVAGKDGDQVVWRYAGEHPPTGGIGKDDWRHPIDDAGHPDW